MENSLGKQWAPAQSGSSPPSREGARPERPGTSSLLRPCLSGQSGAQPGCLPSMCSPVPVAPLPAVPGVVGCSGASPAASDLLLRAGRGWLCQLCPCPGVASSGRVCRDVARVGAPARPAAPSLPAYGHRHCPICLGTGSCLVSFPRAFSPSQNTQPAPSASSVPSGLYFTQRCSLACQLCLSSGLVSFLRYKNVPS